ncbi:MAG: hypothetical protein QME66_04240 [Candidatus Eisenbacteria bacterium]|nr:hypothetical protein [Candidatus Eisenbacteria bacterium]
MKPTKTQKARLYTLLRKAVIRRDGEICQKCGKTQILHLSHIYPKGKYRRMEFELDNVKLLCAGCHIFWWHKNPIEAHEWLQTVVPKERLDKLRLQAQYIDKSPIDYAALELYLENI